MKALSIRQPWAWLILNAGKEFENREWSTQYRGPLLIHASKTCSQADYMAAQLYMADDMFDGIHLPKREDLSTGGIVGVVDVVDCVTQSNSIWFQGPYALKLANPRPLPFTPWKGQLRMFDVSDDVFTRLEDDQIFLSGKMVGGGA
jgi:hypothetical protein